MKYNVRGKLYFTEIFLSLMIIPIIESYHILEKFNIVAIFSPLIIMATNQIRLPALSPLPVWFVEGSCQVVSTKKKKLFHYSINVFMLSFIFCQTLGPELTQSSRRILTEAPSLNSHNKKISILTALKTWRYPLSELWEYFS